MNPGGGPERDDLPPVDVEIPDDARELDRDVQAYYREQRALRRRTRGMRVHRALARDGMVTPLLICCLIFALITGTLLTLFTANPIDPSRLSGTTPKQANSAHPSGANSTPTPPAAATTAPSQLESAVVDIAGKPHLVRSIGPAVLLVVPSGCGSACTRVVAQLAQLAAAAHEQTYLVAAPAALRQSASMAGELGHGLQTASDVAGTLEGPAYSHSGLTAILVSTNQAVSYAQQVHASDLAGLVSRI